MMLKVLLLTIITADAPSSEPPGDILKSIQIFYHDSVTTRGKDVYRELTRVGEDPFSKPTTIDVVLTFTDVRKSSDMVVEILIEELYQPTDLNSTFNSLQRRTWIPHKVIYRGNTNLVKNGRIEVKNVNYQTAYFNDSMLYQKIGFRLVGIYYDRITTKLERVEKEILFDP